MYINRAPLVRGFGRLWRRQHHGEGAARACARAPRAAREAPARLPCATRAPSATLAIRYRTDTKSQENVL